MIACTQFIVNRVHIFYWHRQKHIEHQYIEAIPLDLKGLTYFLTFNGLCTLTYICYLRAAFSDPGRIPEGTSAPFKSEYSKMHLCAKCEGKETWKPIRAHHCRECGFCVFKMDHHCPWINNCVGHRNTKYFLQFLFYLMSTSMMVILLTTKTAIAIMTDRWPRRHIKVA